jgi:hypothetical protein
MYNGMSFDIFAGKAILYMPFLMVCGTSLNSSQFKSYGITKLKDPHMIGLKPQKVKEVKVLAKKKLLK